MEITVGQKLVFTLRYTNVKIAPPESKVTIFIEVLSENESTLMLVQEFITIPANMAQRTVAWEHMMGKLATLISD